MARPQGFKKLILILGWLYCIGSLICRSRFCKHQCSLIFCCQRIKSLPRSCDQLLEAGHRPVTLAKYFLDCFSFLRSCFIFKCLSVSVAICFQFQNFALRWRWCSLSHFSSQTWTKRLILGWYLKWNLAFLRSAAGSTGIWKDLSQHSAAQCLRRFWTGGRNQR